MEDVNTRKFLFLSLTLGGVAKNSLQGNSPTFEVGNPPESLKKQSFFFNSDVFTAVAVVVVRAPL